MIHSLVGGPSSGVGISTDSEEEVQTFEYSQQFFYTRKPYRISESFVVLHVYSSEDVNMIKFNYEDVNVLEMKGEQILDVWHKRLSS